MEHQWIENLKWATIGGIVVWIMLAPIIYKMRRIITNYRRYFDKLQTREDGNG